MFSKTCPWCEQKVTLHQLGQRPAKPLPKWYQFSRNVKVCPYCAGAVKLDEARRVFMLLLIPLFLAFIVEILFDFVVHDVMYFQELLWLLFVIGMAGIYITLKFVKIEAQEAGERP